MCCFHSPQTEAVNINSTHQELKTQSNTQQCAHSGGKKPSLHISYPITKRVLPLLCRDNRWLCCFTKRYQILQWRIHCCYQILQGRMHWFAFHVFIHWSVVKYNATVFTCVCCSKKSSTIYLYIYSYITKRLTFKINISWIVIHVL